jgi:mannose-6-phosphate isomerase
MSPIRLLPLFRERIWGRQSLAPYFARTVGDAPIGEVWFTSEDNQTSVGVTLGELIASRPGILGETADPSHPGVCPLLVKLLFTSERLSVQVHPGDDYARKHHDSLGKTEAWYVIGAEPDAEVAVGFRDVISPERLWESTQNGEIEHLLDWRPVKPGDLVYVPAGTVHAIGGGLTICEIQQNSDITYRLYDYLRPRELHLEHGAKVAKLGPSDCQPQPRTLAAGRMELAANRYFRLERLRLSGELEIAAELPVYLLLVCLAGSGTINEQRFDAGECWLLPASAAETVLHSAESEWILAYTASVPLANLQFSAYSSGSH